MWVGRPYHTTDEPRTAPPPFMWQVRMYYFSVPPFLYHGICTALLTAREKEAARVAGLANGRKAQLQLPSVGDVEERFVLDKPFGKDTDSCSRMV